MSEEREGDPRIPQLVKQPDGTFKYETEEEEAVPWEVAACAYYAECGQIAQTARQFHKTHYQIKKLMGQAWWQDEVARLRKEAVVKADAGYSKLLDLTTEQLIDRVVKGEVVRMKENKESGEMEEVRMPLTTANLVRINDLAFMKRQLLRSEPTEIQGGTQALSILAQKLRALGAKNPSIIDASTGEVSDE